MLEFRFASDSIDALVVPIGLLFVVRVGNASVQFELVLARAVLELSL